MERIMMIFVHEQLLPLAGLALSLCLALEEDTQGQNPFAEIPS